MLIPQTTPPFTPEALAIVFERSNFKSFQKAGYPSHYWAPLISAFSGTRRNEIFVLTPDDVRQQYGIWVMHIKGSGSQKVPSASVTRAIPLHPALKRLGFLQFVQARRQTHPNQRLFSEYKAIQEHAGMVFSRAFVNWIKTTVRQLPDEQKHLFSEDFHFPSLRALFALEASRSAISEHTFRKVYGINNDLQQAGDEAQEQRDLAKAEAELSRMDIESYFPPLYPYEELMARG